MLVLLSIFGELERFISEELYPYRVAITAVLILIAAATVLIAVRQGLHIYLWRHRLGTAVVGGPLLVVSVIAGNYFLSPLWERSFLDEASPLEVARMAPNTGQPAGVPIDRSDTRITLRGMFKGADDFHFGRGEALVIRTESGSNVLRFENFSVRNGPDLYVYLSRDESGKRVEEALNLGRLKATDGAFNYELPSNVDLTGVKSVVVWCRQFAVQFAVAPLM